MPLLSRTLSAFVFALMLLFISPASSGAASCAPDALCVFVGAAFPSSSPQPTPASPFSEKIINCVMDRYLMTENGMVVANWNSLLPRVAEKYGVPAKALCTLLKMESKGRFDAVGHSFSKCGERSFAECGAFQIMAFHFKKCGGSLDYSPYASFQEGGSDPKSCFLPENNADAAANLFSGLLRSCKGNLSCALKKYNGSPKYAASAMNIYRSLA